MSTDEKAQVLEKVETSHGPKRKAMAKLHVPKSTYYRWRARQRQGRLEEDRRYPGPSWNRLSPQEESVVLEVAMEYTDLSSRQVAAWITDNKDFSVSESTVYRLLRCQGLVKSPEMKVAAGNEYHTKTRRPHQMWATDASYFRVAGWGFYYLVTVMDDFSRFILAWKLQRDMTSDSFIEVVQDAVDLTGMTEVPMEDRTRLLSDNGPGYVSRSSRDYLHLAGHSSHSGLTVPSADQRQAGEISPVNQTGCEPDPIRCPCKLECGYCRLRELLQLSAISQGVGQRDPFGRVERPERTDTSETEGGSGPNDTTATIVQSSTQRARNISSKSPLIFCPICADSQQHFC